MDGVKNTNRLASCKRGESSLSVSKRLNLKNAKRKGERTVALGVRGNERQVHDVQRRIARCEPV